jgi:hypothetical protein
MYYASKWRPKEQKLRFEQSVWNFQRDSGPPVVPTSLIDIHLRVRYNYESADHLLHLPSTR